MDSTKISNSIYISMATLESLLIFISGADFSFQSYYGFIWIFPLMLYFIPIYRVMKANHDEVNKKKPNEIK